MSAWRLASTPLSILLILSLPPLPADERIDYDLQDTRSGGMAMRCLSGRPGYVHEDAIIRRLCSPLGITG